MNRRPWSIWLLILLATTATAPGCAPGIDTTYGRVRGRSVNGTGVLAELCRQAGHSVRVAVRLNEQLAEEADTIFRFAPYPGPPSEEEGDWYLDWLDQGAERRLIYVCQDYDAEAEYWSGVLADLPADDPQRGRIEPLRDEARRWVNNLPEPAEHPADPDYWFELEAAPSGPTLCQDLNGPWASGIDPQAAAITRHQTLNANFEEVLLEGDGLPMAMEWYWNGDCKILVVANGSFLLNATLVNPARRPLALEVVKWAGETPRQVVFVEGNALLSASGDAPPSPWELFSRLPTLAWIAAHFAVLGLLAALAFAVTLGRPRPSPSAGADRPRAHAEALGALLAKTRDESAARSLLEIYARWRHAPGHDPR